jgi:hypothetical protein
MIWCVIRRPPKKPAPSEPWRTRSRRKYQYWTISGGGWGGGNRISIAWKRTNETSVVAKNVTRAKRRRLTK